jgi:CBS-domain-containing membrane protein
MMREADTGVLPVAEGDRLIGMLTDRDVAVRLVAEGRDPTQTKVRDVMTAEVRYVFEDEELEHVAENMAEQQVRRLPVMNRQKRLVGVVSLGDMAKGRHSPLTGRALRGIARQGGQHTGGLSSGGTTQVDQGHLPKRFPLATAIASARLLRVWAAPGPRDNRPTEDDLSAAAGKGGLPLSG